MCIQQKAIWPPTVVSVCARVNVGAVCACVCVHISCRCTCAAYLVSACVFARCVHELYN